MDNEREFTVTAIRHTLAPGKPKEEQNRVCEAFLSTLSEGETVFFVAETDNIYDAEAIAAYFNYRKIGYCNKENTAAVAAYFDENQQCKATVKRTDHVTLWVCIQGEPKRPVKPRPRTLPALPFEEQVRMPFNEEERRLCFIASRLASIEVSKDNIKEIADLAANYVPLMKMSICYEENVWMDEIDKKLHGICSRPEELGLKEKEAEAMRCIYNNVHEAVGDMHCTSEGHIECIFDKHLNRLRRDTASNGFLFQQYCKSCLGGKTFCEADKELIISEHDRLLGWLKALKWTELRDPTDTKAMAKKVNYLRLSRRELYDLYSVLLLLEKLEATGHAGSLAAFWNRLTEARKTLITTKRHWFVPCKWLMWKGYVEEGDFRTAVSMLQEHFPDLELDSKDLSKLNVDSFHKPFSQWREDDAPVNGKTFKKYYDLAAFLMQE